MDGSLNFLRRMKDGQANRHSRRRAAKRPPRWPRGGETGTAKRWLVVTLGVLALVGGIVAAVRAGTPAVTSFGITTAQTTPNYVNGRWIKGATVSFRAQIADTTTPYPDPAPNGIQFVSASGIDYQWNASNASSGNMNPAPGKWFYVNNATLPGGPGAPGQDNFNAQWRATDGHGGTPPPIGTANLEFRYGHSPELLDHQVNPRVGTQNSVYEFFVKIRDYDREQLQGGGPRIWIRQPWDPNNDMVSGALMQPFEVDGTVTGAANIGKFITLPPDGDNRWGTGGGIWYRYAVQITNKDHWVNGFFQWRVAFRDVDGIVANAGANTTRRDTMYPVQDSTTSYWNSAATDGANQQSGASQNAPEMRVLNGSNFRPCTASGGADVNPNGVNEGGVFVNPVDPQYDRQGTGSSTYTFYFYTDPNLGLAVPQGIGNAFGATPAGRQTWRSPYFDPWRNLDEPGYPSNPCPVMIRFEMNGNASFQTDYSGAAAGTSNWDSAHHMEYVGNGIWRYIVRPGDPQVSNAPGTSLFTNSGRGKPWFNNFENFSFNDAYSAGYWIARLSSRGENHAPGDNQGFLRFRYEIPRDIVIWSPRARLIGTADDDNTGGTDQDGTCVNPWPGDANMTDNSGTNGTVAGLAYPAPPSTQQQWVSYDGRGDGGMNPDPGNQSSLFMLGAQYDRLQVDPTLRADGTDINNNDAGSRAKANKRPDFYSSLPMGIPGHPAIYAPAHYAASRHTRFNEGTQAVESDVINTPNQWQTEAVSSTTSSPAALWRYARGSVSWTWPLRIRYFQSQGQLPYYIVVHLARANAPGGTYTEVPGSPFNMVEEDASDIIVSDGKWYRYSFQAKDAPGPGCYRYWFEANDRTRTTAWPGQMADGGQPGTSMHALNLERSINTFRVNNPPVLTNPTVTPGSGTQDGRFKFTIAYQDTDGDRPLKPYLFIKDNGTWRQVIMTQTDPARTLPGDYIAGQQFEYTTGTDFQLTPDAVGGEHQHYFAFTDNWYTVDTAVEGERITMPQTGRSAPYSGPVVVYNTPPTLSGGTATEPGGTSTGTTASVFTYRVKYTDAQNQKPSQIAVYIDPAVANVRANQNVNAPVTERVVTTASVASVQVGDFLKFTSGAAVDRWFYITNVDSVNNRLTISPGFNLLADFDPGAAGTQSVLVNDKFDVVRVSAAQIRPMTQVDPTDTLYTDGADFQYQTRLSSAAHSYFFFACDGFSYVMDSTNSATPPASHITAMPGPTVNPDNQPRLYFPAAQVAHGGTAALVTGRGASWIEIPGPAGALGANEWAGRAIMVYSGSGAAARTIPARETFEITGHLAYAGGGGALRLLVTGNPEVSQVATTDAFEVGSLFTTTDKGPVGTTFRWRITYWDEDNDPPAGPAPAAIRLVLDGGPTSGGSYITGTKVDITDQNYKDGCIYEFAFTATAADRGSHSYFFEANDGEKGVRVPTAASLTGPAVNNAPVLSNGSVSPTAGSEVNMYRFEVRYSDADNDGPDAGFPVLKVWDPDGVMLPGAPFTMTAIDTNSFVAGRVYRYDLQNLAGLNSGPYTYTFEATSTGGGRPQTASLGPINGPYVNRAPTLSAQTVTAATGPRSQAYTYSVRYTDPAIDPADDVGNPPAANNPVLRIYLPASAGGGLVGTYAMTAKATGNDGKYTAAANGEDYEYTVPAGFFTVARQYTYTVDARDSVSANYAPLDAAQVSGNGPTIDDIPVLSNLTVTPAVGVSGAKFDFSARYTHPDNAAPSSIKVFVYKPGGGLLISAGTALDIHDNGIINPVGRVYNISLANRLTLTQRGTYRFYVVATDGAAPSDTVVAPAGADTAMANAVAGPIVTGDPVLSNNSVTPSTGGSGTSFTFSVRYQQAENQPPVAGTLKVYITRPGQPEDAGNAMTTTATSPDYVAGVDYTYSTTLTSGGAYKYRFEVPGVAGQIRLPGPNATDKFSGPTVSNNPPTLTAETVTPTSGRTASTYVYTVTYTDMDNDSPKDSSGNPGKPTLILRSSAGDRTVDPSLIIEVDPTDTTYTDGKVYRYTAKPSPGANEGGPLIEGTAAAGDPHSFRWSASDGANTVATSFTQLPDVNHFPALSAATVNTRTSRVNPATLYPIDPGQAVTFRVTYSDQDGDVPSHIRVQIFKNNATHDPVMSLNLTPQGPTDAASIRNGVTYAGSVTTLAMGRYEYYFEASDGKDDTVRPAGADGDAALRYNDLVINTPPQISLAGVTPAAGLPTDTAGGSSFTWSVRYTDADGHVPTTATLTPAGAANRIRVHVYKPGASASQPLSAGDAQPGAGTVLTGLTYSVSAPINEASDTIGQWAWYVEFHDGIQRHVFPAGANQDRTLAWQEPRVYKTQAGLSDVVIRALNAADPNDTRVVYTSQAGPTDVALSTERVRFEVVYGDLYNNAPTQVQLFLDGSATAYTMTDTGTNQGDAERWAKGVVFSYTTSQPLAAGSHNFVMRANDGSAYHYVASGTRAAGSPPRVDLSAGDNKAAPAVQTLVNPRVSPSGGGLNADYEFAVNFSSLLSATAGYLAGCNAWADVWLQPAGAPTQVPLTQFGSAAAGISFKGSKTLTQAGDYSFRIYVDDGQYVYSTTEIKQPKVAVPELSNLTVSPATGIVGRGFEFAVTYKHGGQQLAQSVTLFIRKADGTPLKAEGYPMKPTEVNTALLPTTGWQYKVTVPIEAPGTYSFTAEAVDGNTPGASKDIEPDPASQTPAPTFTVTPPTLTEPSVTPMAGGYASGTFTFSVKYTYGANKPPALVRLRLTKPDGQPADPVAMVPAADGDYVNGKVFTKSIPLADAGDYAFFFDAWYKDAGGQLVEAAPSATVNGPSVGQPTAPELVGDAVKLATTGGNRYTYTVLYKQTQNLPPAWVRLYIDYQAATGQAAHVVDMTRLDATALDYATGVAYTYTTSQALSPGQHNYRITASNGFEETEKLASGPLINIEPTLEAKKVTPERGDENTTFTFEAIYKDADNQAAEFVKVSVGNKTYTLAQVDATDTNYVDGALYRAQIQLPAGDLSHSFQASDGIATVRAPTNGIVTGPKVLPKTDVALSLNRATVTMDAQTSVMASGALDPALSNVQVTVTFNVLLPQDDESTVEETRGTVQVQTDSDGRFSASYVPDQDGAWNIRAEYAGDVAQGGTYGSGKNVTAFKVEPARHVLLAAVHMLGMPTTPAVGDLRRAITGGEFQTAHYTGNKDVPYLYGPDLPFPSPRAGVGFWLRCGANLQVSASGRLVDHSKEYAITVRPGWQIISNPYLMPTDWQAAEFKTAGQRVALMQAGEWVKSYAWTWDAQRSDFRLLHGAYNGYFEQTDRDLQPWQGAWFYSRVEGELILAPPAGSRAATDDQRTARARHRSTEREWAIQLRATNGRETDGFNYAGVTSQGRGATHSSMASPPTLPGYVDLYFQGPDAASRYATDFRAPVAGEQVWDLSVETDVLDRPVTISSPDLSRLPKTVEVLLEDVDAGGKRIYMRTSGGYTFNPGEGGKRQMRLIVRPRAEGALRVVQVDVSQTRGGRSFNVTLSQDAMVSVEIISPSGQQLAVVADSKATAECRTTLFWDETRKDGARLPAGVYLAKVTAKLPEGQVTQSVRPLVLAR